MSGTSPVASSAAGGSGAPAPRGISRRTVALVGSALAFVVFVALVAVTSLMRLPRLDLTATGSYTLSPGLRAVVQSLDEPVRIDLYWSAEAAKDAPGIVTHAQRVQEFLREVADASRGMVEVRVLDPKPFSEAEDAARVNGIAPITVDGLGRTVSLGLVVTGPTDRKDALPWLNPSDEAFLEYDIARAIISASRASKAKVALITGLPMDSGFDPQARRMTPPWQVLTQMRQLFDVEVVQPSADKLPDGVSAVVIAHPYGMSESLLKALDSYAMLGGNILLFMDPLCESAVEPGSPDAFAVAQQSSDLGPLLPAWGIEWQPAKVVGDRKYAQRVRARTATGLATVEYIAWLLIPKDAIDSADPACGMLANLTLLSAGAVSAAEGSAMTMTPLVRASDETQMLDASKLGSFADPNALLREFAADGVKRVLAARFAGLVKSAYGIERAPDGAPKPATIVVVADADCLRNEAWTQEERLGNLSLGWRVFADNGSLAFNTVEQLTGDKALLTLRARGSAQRPFEVVKELRRQAEERYLKREQELQERIKAAEARINEVQARKSADQMLVLSPEQQTQLEDLQKELVAARSELRQVQLGLREDIESLGHRLMLANVVGWPIVVAIAASLLGVRRAVRRR